MHEHKAELMCVSLSFSLRALSSTSLYHPFSRAAVVPFPLCAVPSCDDQAMVALLAHLGSDESPTSLRSVRMRIHLASCFHLCNAFRRLDADRHRIPSSLQFCKHRL